MNHPRIKDTVQDCNLNFLIGSGLSMPYLSTLGNIEVLITDVERADKPEGEKNLVRISLYKYFFQTALEGNLGILQKEEAAVKVLTDYQAFLSELNTILLRRKSTIISKEINLFTTNVDVFLEMGLETLNLEVNDGFNGRFHPQYSLSHFNTSRYKKSLHFENVAELPIFNLLKLHGSLSWQIEGNERISFSSRLDQVAKIKNLLTPGVNSLSIEAGDTATTLLARSVGQTPNAEAMAFMQAYDQLLIVNPTKEKFKHTLLNQTYYELLRIYSNELEKENTVLFALGFSFADEHIREITLRSLNSNPTLAVLIVAFNEEAGNEILSRFPAKQIRNSNLFVIKPPMENVEDGKPPKPKYAHTLKNITEHIFGTLLPAEPSDTEE